MLPGVGGKTDMRGKLTRICSFPNEINPMCNRWCSVKCCSMYFCFNVSKMHQEGKQRFLMLVQERRKKKRDYARNRDELWYFAPSDALNSIFFFLTASRLY